MSPQSLYRFTSAIVNLNEGGPPHLETNDYVLASDYDLLAKELTESKAENALLKAEVEAVKRFTVQVDLQDDPEDGETDLVVTITTDLPQKERHDLLMWFHERFKSGPGTPPLAFTTWPVDSLPAPPVKQGEEKL